MVHSLEHNKLSNDKRYTKPGFNECAGIHGEPTCDTVYGNHITGITEDGNGPGILKEIQYAGLELSGMEPHRKVGLDQVISSGSLLPYGYHKSP